MTRVCLYTRISTDEENQPTSLHSQHERLEAFCNVQEGWRIVAHEEDRSTGGRTYVSINPTAAHNET